MPVFLYNQTQYQMLHTQHEYGHLISGEQTSMHRRTHAMLSTINVATIENTPSLNATQNDQQ